jgi:hypothetical protein
VCAAAIERAPLRPLAALLLHQTEEWVWPGSFLPWINRTVLGSDDDEFPIDRRTAFAINVVFGWGGSLAAAKPERAAVPAAVLYTSHLGNAALHISWAVRRRRYDPGVVTAALALVPVAVIGLRELYENPDVSARAMRIGVIQGALSAAALPSVLRRRLRRRNRARRAADAT